MTVYIRQMRTLRFRKWKSYGLVRLHLSRVAKLGCELRPLDSKALDGLQQGPPRLGGQKTLLLDPCPGPLTNMNHPLQIC